jgi:hydrogenase/urease accessory protein HupE
MHRSALIAPTLLTTAAAAVAHPGHGDPSRGSGFLHHLAEPVHILTGLLLVAGVVALARLARARRHARD